MLPKWNLADIKERMFNTPLYVTPEKAQIALGVIGPKLDIGALVINGNASQPVPMASLAASAAAAKAEFDQMPGDNSLARRDWESGEVLDPYEIWNGVGVIPIRGSLMSENGLNPSSGVTGYDGLSYKTRHAAADSRVKGVALDIESPGGGIVDLAEFCNELLALAEIKPVRAIVRGCCASAAYHIAATLPKGSIYAPEYAMVGSIGAIIMHADFSKALEQDGIAVTLIESAPHKSGGSPFKPLDDETRSFAQNSVDAAAARFIAHVSEHRKMSADALRAQEARVYQGEAALDAGLIDKIMSWPEAIKDFAQQVNGSGSSRAANGPSGSRSSKGTNMSIEASAPAADQQPDLNEAVIAAARAEGHAEGVKAGATAENARIMSLAELDQGTTLSAGFTEAVTSGGSAGDFAIGLAKAAAAKPAAALANLEADAVSGDDLPDASAAAANPGAKGKTNRGQGYAERKAAAKKG